MKRDSKKDNLAKNTAYNAMRLGESSGPAMIVGKSSKPPSTPTVPAPEWARYVDSRLKQFCTR